MAVTIGTTTGAKPFAQAHAIQVDSNGNLWATWLDNANDRYVFFWSDDDGATWTENTSMRITVDATYADESSFSINTDGDIAVMTISTTNTTLGDHGIWTLPADDLTNAGAWFDTATALPAGAGVDCVVFDFKSVDRASLAYGRAGTAAASSAAVIGRLKYISGDWTIDGNRGDLLLGAALDGSIRCGFEHTGDGQTPVGDPDV